MSDSKGRSVTENEPGPAEGRFVAPARLEPLNRDIQELVARHPDRSPEELVPELAALMRKHGVPEPSLDGMILWLDQAQVSAHAAAEGQSSAEARSGDSE
jgi:hypothetical protein